MYLDFPNISENPFRISPDPRFLYLSERHARAKSYIESAGNLIDGFVVITGEIGTGKTILINDFLANSGPDVVAVEIHQTQITAVQFLQTLLVRLGFEPFKKKKAELLHMVNSFLLRNFEAGKHTVLIIDEAQLLSLQVLEEIRLLSGIQTGDKRILSVILAGQPAFKEKLSSPCMEQLAQRTPLHIHLAALDEAETEAYVQHRLNVAGDLAGKVFMPETFELIFRYTRGVPRLINTLCGTALLCAFADDLKVVSKHTVIAALAELQWVADEQDKVVVAPRGKLNKTVADVDSLENEIRELRVPIISNGNQRATEFSGTALTDAHNRPDELASLVPLNGSAASEHPIRKGRLSLGSSPDNDIRIKSDYISAHHAQIISSSTDSFLGDLNSTNGTYVNSKRIKRHALRDGDLITIGKHHFKYVKQNTGISGHESDTNGASIKRQRTGATD